MRRLRHPLATGALTLVCACSASSSERNAPPTAAAVVIQPASAASPVAHVCAVRVARFRLAAEATVHASDKKAAHRESCQQACAKLGKPCSEIDGILIRPLTQPSKSGHTTRCEISKRDKVLERASSPVSRTEACAAAYRKACPPPCEDGSVYEVDGIDRARLDAIAAHARDAAPISDGAKAASCELVASVLVREATAKGKSREGQSLDALREETRAEACKLLGVDATTCGDRERVWSTRTSTQLSITNGVSSSSFEATFALFRHVKGVGHGSDKEAACRAAAQQLCTAGACETGKLTLRAIDGVPLNLITPKHSLFE